jgi:uncharacterized membrane protein
MIAQGISENRYLIPRWLVLTLLAVVCWGLWAIISKLIGDTITASQSQALSTVGVIPVMLVLSQSKKLVSAGNRRRGALNSFIAGALCCGGNVAYYHALNVGGKASNVVPLTALYPLVTVLLAVVFLREILSPPQFIGIGLSLVAIYLFNGVGVQGLASSWLIYAMIPIALWGVSALLQKISTNDISGELSALWFLAAFVPCAVVLLILQPLNHHVPARTWMLAAALGLFFSLGNYAILAAFANHGKASIIAPLSGLYPLVSVPIAIFLLGEKIGARETAGIAVALASVLALACERSSNPGLEHEPAH